MKYKILIILIVSLISCNKKEKQTELLDKTTVESNINQVDTLKSKESDPEIIAPKGTQIFQNSKKLHELKWENGYLLNSIKVLECDDSAENENNIRLDKKIQEIIINEDSFTISFKAVENCCSKFLCEAEINDNTLNIIYNVYGSQCSCYCLFEMSYTFGFNVRLEEIEVEKTKIKYIILNGDEKSKAIFK